MKALILAAVSMVGFAGAAMACPDFNLRAVEAYQASGSQLRSPKTFNVVAGGDNYVWNCRNVRPNTDQGAGYFTSQPDFSFDLSGMGGLQLVISAVSECDSALLINTGSASWYYDDDDNGNLDPRIVLTRPANGRIDVWMGTYDGEYCNARLRLETFAR
ncbi:hypothetical protein SAMN04488515_0767 [Cognatiyoonia koreensis]|uniref:Uncharacterized protein n=1 Tax=Cognatiyoonia koreensis TaxID=364200 RepID=A0A1I0NR62_9RHOB|nr:hypothetical protein [Cognatiyoonia koreensis]SEW03864.1 hypothetical protein SAMN04488515_0767 [Cognatiyoonia koreensis]